MKIDKANANWMVGIFIALIAFFILSIISLIAGLIRGGTLPLQPSILLALAIIALRNEELHSQLRNKEKPKEESNGRNRNNNSSS